MSLEYKYIKKDAAEFSGLDLRNTQFYCDEGVIGFQKKTAGRGHKRRYCKANLLEAKVAKTLSGQGMTLGAIKAVKAYMEQPSLKCFEQYHRYLKGRCYIFINFDHETGKLNIRAQIKGGPIKEKDCVLTVSDLDKFPNYWVLNFSRFASDVDAY